MNALLVYATFESAGQAREIARHVVEARLAACANIFEAHESLYWWDGAVQNAFETAAIFKTTTERFENLKAEIIRLHSYDCPCVVALSIAGGHEAFLQWIGAETG